MKLKQSLQNDKISEFSLYSQCFLILCDKRAKIKIYLVRQVPYFFGYKTEFFPSKTIPKI